MPIPFGRQGLVARAATLCAGLALGCAAPPVSDVGPEDTDLPGAWDYTQEVETEPELSLTDIEVAIAEALGTALFMDGGAVLDLYDTVMAGRDDDCPYFYTTGASAYWYDYCSSDDGTYFAGIGTLITTSSTVENDFTNEGQFLQMSGSVTMPDGYTFAGSGTASYDQMAFLGDREGTLSTRSGVNGGFAFEGPAVEGTWLATDLAPDISVTAGWVNTGTAYGRALTIDGGIGGLEGAASAVVFTGIYLAESTLGSACAIEPEGGMSIRDASGNWYELAFDGVGLSDGTLDASACDGCGAVTWQGQSLGQACGDFSILFDWEESPW